MRLILIAASLLFVSAAKPIILNGPGGAVVGGLLWSQCGVTWTELMKNLREGMW